MRCTENAGEPTIAETSVPVDTAGTIAACGDDGGKLYRKLCRGNDRELVHTPASRFLAMSAKRR
jgi:hypothetical protein